MPTWHFSPLTRRWLARHDLAVDLDGLPGDQHGLPVAALDRGPAGSAACSGSAPKKTSCRYRRAQAAPAPAPSRTGQPAAASDESLRAGAWEASRARGKHLREEKTELRRPSGPPTEKSAGSAPSLPTRTPDQQPEDAVPTISLNCVKRGWAGDLRGGGKSQPHKREQPPDRVTEITRPGSDLAGAKRGAIACRHGASSGLVKLSKCAFELASGHCEPHWPTSESSFASRVSVTPRYRHQPTKLATPLC